MYAWMYKPLCVCCSLKVMWNVKTINVLEHLCCALFLCHASADSGIYPYMLCWSLLQVISVQVMKKILPPSVHLFMAVRYYIYKKISVSAPTLVLNMAPCGSHCKNKIRNWRRLTLLLINPFPWVISENAC